MAVGARRRKTEAHKSVKARVISFWDIETFADHAQSVPLPIAIWLFFIDIELARRKGLGALEAAKAARVEL